MLNHKILKLSDTYIDRFQGEDNFNNFSNTFRNIYNLTIFENCLQTLIWNVRNESVIGFAIIVAFNSWKWKKNGEKKREDENSRNEIRWLSRNLLRRPCAPEIPLSFRK